jgi:hypothetical protein
MPDRAQPPGSSPPGRVPLGAAAGAGLATAALVPLDRPGLGWALAGLAACCGTAAGVWRGRPTRPRLAPPRWYRSTGWGLVALALLATGAFRAAGWLFLLCLCAAAAATWPGSAPRWRRPPTTGAAPTSAAPPHVTSWDWPAPR